MSLYCKLSICLDDHKTLSRENFKNNIFIKKTQQNVTSK